MKSEVIAGKNAERTICDYVDLLMSTWNPNPPSETWSKPASHPYKKSYCNIAKENWEKDYSDLVNTVQRHILLVAPCIVGSAMPMLVKDVVLAFLFESLIGHTLSMKKFTLTKILLNIDVKVVNIA